MNKKRKPTKLELLQRSIKKVFAETNCMDLYGSNDNQRLQVIEQVMRARREYIELVDAWMLTTPKKTEPGQ